MTKISYKFFK